MNKTKCNCPLLSFQVLCLLFSLVLTSVFVVGQNQSAMSAVTGKPSTNSAAHHLEVKDFEQVVPYWTTEGSWRSELQLRNNVNGQNLTVTPSLRTADGAETILPAVTIKPQEIKTLDISDEAPQIGRAYGSIVLRYHSAFSGALYASLMLLDLGHPIAVHLDAIPADDTLQGVSREGVWWLPNGTTSDYLVLTNQRNTVLKLDMSIYDARGTESKQTLALGPRQTMRYSVRQLVQSVSFSGSFGGIKVAAKAHAGSLDTIHFLFDEQTGFSALLKMFDHDPAVKIEARDFAHTGVWTQRATMLALSQPDPSLGFPEGTSLQPQMFVRNTTAKPVSAALRFNWRGQSTSGKAVGPTLNLAPFQTQRIDITALQDGVLPKDANWTSVTLTTQGHPGELVAVAASYDATLRYGAQTPFSDQLSFRWEGGLWQYDVQHDSIITAGNGGTKPTQAAFTIFYNQGKDKYELEQTLQPDEQMWIDVGKLIRQGVPDKNGTTLPMDLTSGSYEFRDLTNLGVGSLFEGKVIYDKTYGHVTYGCAHCCGIQSTYLQYSPLGVPLLGTSPNGVEADDSCGNTGLRLSSLFYGNWTTANTSIATVNYYATHTGVAAGSTTSLTHGTINAAGRASCPQETRSDSGPTNVEPLQITNIDPTIAMIGSNSVQITINGSGFGPSPTVNLPPGFSSNGQGSTDTSIVITVNIDLTATIGNNSITVSAGGKTSNAATFTVNGPNKMVVQANTDVIGPTTTNPSAKSRFVTYQVQNVDGTVAANIPVAEVVTRTGWNCTQSDPGFYIAQCNAQYSTTANGILKDEWGMFTGYTPITCGVNMTDHWQWCGPAGWNPPAPNPGKTFGTLNGWIHTQDSMINGYQLPPNAMPGGFVIVP
jgi:hypothetical protein